MLDRVNRQLATIRNEQAKLDAQMRQPGNAVVLDRSILINTLIRRKAISWTKIFADLETVCRPTSACSPSARRSTRKIELFLDMTGRGRRARTGHRLYRRSSKAPMSSAPPRSAAHAALADRYLLPLPPLGELCPETLIQRHSVPTAAWSRSRGYLVRVGLGVLLAANLVAAGFAFHVFGASPEALIRTCRRAIAAARRTRPD